MIYLTDIEQRDYITLKGCSTGILWTMYHELKPEVDECCPTGKSAAARKNGFGEVVSMLKARAEL